MTRVLTQWIKEPWWKEGRSVCSVVCLKNTSVVVLSPLRKDVSLWYEKISLHLKAILSTLVIHLSFFCLGVWLSWHNCSKDGIKIANARGIFVSLFLYTRIEILTDYKWKWRNLVHCQKSFSPYFKVYKSTGKKWISILLHPSLWLHVLGTFHAEECHLTGMLFEYKLFSFTP